MLSQDEQVALFVDAINKNALKMCREIEKEAKKFYSDEASKLEKAAKAEMEEKLEIAENRIMTELNRRSATEKSRARNELYKRREELTNAVFKKAEAMLVRFASSEEYVTFLEKSIGKIASYIKCPFVIFVKSGDESIIADAVKKTGADYKVEISPDIKIGGVRAFSTEGNISIDDTLDERLLEQKEWFLSHTGKELNI